MLKIQITVKSVHWHTYVTIKEEGRIWISCSEMKTELEKVSFGSLGYSTQWMGRRDAGTGMCSV